MSPSTMFGIARFVFYLLLIGSTTNSKMSMLAFASFSDHEEPKDASSYHLLKMIEWLRSIPGGYLSSTVQIRRADPSNPHSYFGIFASQDLEKDELIMNIPAEARLEIDSKWDDYAYEYTDVLCDLAWTLREEFDLGPRSKHVHYVNYLKEQRRDIIPAVWSHAGKELLMDVQGGIFMKDYEQETADAEHMVNWIDEWFLESCLMDEEGKEGEGDQCLDPYFVAVVTQRGFDSMLAPVYDFMNNHNGKVNTINQRSIYHRNGFDIYASQPIAAGDELFFSYFNCPDCRSCSNCPITQSYWGTPEMLRDFGFVEPYPHHFYLGDHVSMIVREDKNDTSLRIEFPDGKFPNEAVVGEAKLEIERLAGINESILLPANSTVTKHEYDTIIQYHKALMTAFTLMVEAYESEFEFESAP
jgi:hypothetical protein